MHSADHRTAARQRGFSLVELMVTVTVMGVIAAIAVPSMRRLTIANAITAAGNEIVTATQLARMEAVRRRATVNICPTTNGTTCAGAEWKRFIVATAAGVVIREVVLRPGDYRVTSSLTNNLLSYGASGFATMGTAPAPANGTISSCTTRLASNNRVNVHVAMSRVSSTRSTTSGC